MSPTLARVPFHRPADAIKVYLDNSRYICGFGVRSSSGGADHKVSYDVMAYHWVCSCRGGIFHGKCHHMDDHGLKGRKYVQQTGQAVPMPVWAGSRADAVPMPDLPKSLTSMPVIRRFRFED